MGISDRVEDLIEGRALSAHVATAVDDRPHVAPIWYGYRDGTISFITGGRKLENLRRNPRVAVSIEEAEGGDVAWNAVLFGRATVIDDPERIAEAEAWIYDAYETDDAASEDDDGATSESRDDASADAATDEEGGEAATDTDEYALVEVTVASDAHYVYD